MNESDNLTQLMFLQISHTYFIKLFQQISGYGLYPGQMPVIKTLHEQNGLTQSEIAKKLKVKPSTVAVSIRRLEKAGMVMRQPDGSNQRRYRVYLTEQAEKIGDKMQDILRENEKHILAGFDEKERCMLEEFFRRLLENIQKIPDDSDAGEVRKKKGECKECFKC